MSDLIYKGTSLQGISSHAQNVFYNNTDSELEATNVNAAIDEVNEKFDNLNLSANEVSYSNTTSGLSATDVQDAIDEVSDSANIDYDNTTSGLTATKVKGAIDQVSANANKALNKIQRITSLAGGQTFITSIDGSRRYMVVCTGASIATMGVYLLSTTAAGAPTLAGVRPFDSGGSTISASTNQLTIYNGAGVVMTISLIDLL